MTNVFLSTEVYLSVSVVNVLHKQNMNPKEPEERNVKCNYVIMWIEEKKEYDCCVCGDENV